jgi:hypothetical protein
METRKASQQGIPNRRDMFAGFEPIDVWCVRVNMGQTGSFALPIMLLLRVQLYK